MRNDVRRRILRIEHSIASAPDASVFNEHTPLIRVRSTNELKQTVRMPGYYTFFCIHDVHKWTRCAPCRRTQRSADALREKYHAKLSQALGAEI